MAKTRTRKPISNSTEKNTINRKPPRRSITLGTKYEIISSHAAGKQVKDLCAMFSLTSSTVCTILKDKDRYLKGIKNYQSMKSAWCRKKNLCSLVPQMEKLLNTWVREQQELLNKLTYETIRTKALSTFEMLKEKNGGKCSETFLASRGWYARYKKRECRLIDRNIGESLFPKMLKEIIDEGQYSQSQIFNVGETNLFWKRLPSRHCSEGEKSSTSSFNTTKESVTVLLGGNAAGDCQLKPMIVHSSENTKELKGIVKATLPVIWKTNQTATVTPTIFEEWFSNHFVPEVKRFCIKKKIPFRIILILNDASGHPPALQYHHPNIRVTFLPPKSTSLLQPMNQGIFSLFKVFYLRDTLEMIINELDKDCDTTLENILDKFNTKDVIKITESAWSKISKKNKTNVWKQLCPQFLDSLEEFEDPENTVRTETKEIVKLAERLNLEVSESDVIDLIQDISKEINGSGISEKDVEDIATETPVSNLTISKEITEKQLFQKRHENFAIEAPVRSLTTSKEITEMENFQKRDEDFATETPVRNLTLDQEAMKMEDFVKKDEDLEAETPVRYFTLEGLNEAFRCIKKAIQIFESQDSNFERNRKVTSDLENAFTCYRNIYKDKKRHTWNQRVPNELPTNHCCSNSMECQESPDSLTEIKSEIEIFQPESPTFATSCEDETLFFPTCSTSDQTTDTNIQ